MSHYGIMPLLEWIMLLLRYAHYVSRTVAILLWIIDKVWFKVLSGISCRKLIHMSLRNTVILDSGWTIRLSVPQYLRWSVFNYTWSQECVMFCHWQIIKVVLFLTVIQHNGQVMFMFNIFFSFFLISGSFSSSYLLDNAKKKRSIIYPELHHLS